MFKKVVKILANLFYKCYNQKTRLLVLITKMSFSLSCMGESVKLGPFKTLNPNVTYPTN